MVSGEIFTAIDIGSNKIKTIIGTFSEDKKLRVLGVGITPSLAVRKGNILDMEEFKKNINDSLEEAERMTGEQVHNAYMTISGTGISVDTNKGIVAIMDHEITEDDVNRGLDMAQNGVDLQNRVVLKVIPETFSLDFEGGIKNPIGMNAKKLEVVAHIFSIGANILNNIKKGVYDNGVDITDIYPALITTPEAVLSKRQKELGVVCIDIGANTTDVTVYEEGVLIYATVIPLGGENVTSDVALGTRISIDIAEKLKTEYGDVNLCKSDKKDEEIDLEKIIKSESGKVSSIYLSEIIRARYGEIFYFISSELKKIGKDGMLPEGAVLTGGGAKIKGILELSKDILRLPSSIGLPEDSDYISGTSVSDPIFSGVIGTLILSQRYSTHKSSSIKLNIGGFWSSFKKLFGKIVPK